MDYNNYLVILVDKVDDDFDHGVFFFGAAFGNHEGKGNEGVVGNAFVAIAEEVALVYQIL